MDSNVTDIGSKTKKRDLVKDLGEIKKEDLDAATGALLSAGKATVVAAFALAGAFLGTKLIGLMEAFHGEEEKEEEEREGGNESE